MWEKLLFFFMKYDGILIIFTIIGINLIYLIKNENYVIIFFLSIFIISLILFFTLKQKRDEIDSGFKNILNPNNELLKEKEMKKIVFDDLQVEKGGKIVITEVIEDNTPKATPISSVTSIKEKAMDDRLQNIKSKSETIPHEFQISDFFDIEINGVKGGPDPKTEFDYLLGKILKVIKEVTFAHTVAFFWANREKQQMVCEEKVTDSQYFLKNRKFQIGHDLVSKVALNSKPELISRVNPVSEKELIVYYSELQFIKSFVGVPVFFKSLNAESVEEAVGVIAVDSKTEDAFGYETILLLSQFTKLISGIIKSYTDKYDLILDVELLNSIHRLQAKIKENLKPSTVSSAIIDECSKLLKWDFISVVMQDEKKQTWMVDKVVSRTNEAYIHSGTNIDFDDCIVGNVILNNSHQLIENLEGLQKTRFFVNEKLNNEGSFVSVPISSINKCYGAICVESKDKYCFSKQDIEVLYRLAENAAAGLEIYYMSQLIAEYVIVDELTGVYSKKFWMEKFTDEFVRSEDFSEDLSLLMISVDKMQDLFERYGKTGINKLLVTLSRIIRSSVRPYDLVGRLDDNQFGVILVKTPANEAYLWAEKIRKTIAGYAIEIDDKSFSVTVSIGLCGAIEGGSQQDLIKNAKLVLQKAIGSGGNTVRVF